ncbi:MAG TPA: alpha/beta fold hydrolase [Alphaproteobacteria bacterium]|nr:alpha/beta fold hydrolase [Alphaproteobacteria bacterium]
MKRILTALGVAALFVAFAASARADDKLGIVLMHGKMGAPMGQSGLAKGKPSIGARLIADLKGAGYLVAAPEMCWSRRRNFDKPYPDCLAELDGVIADLKAHGATRIVVSGLSLGGNAAIAYGATHAGLLGVIAYGPADDPGKKAARPEIAAAIRKAERLAFESKGDVPTTFDDVNTGPQGTFDTTLHITPNIYLSFYGPKSLAHIPATTAKLKAPLLWIAGNSDPTQRGGQAYAFGNAPSNPMNRYIVVSATHLQTPDAGRAATLAWLADLVKP